MFFHPQLFPTSLSQTKKKKKIIFLLSFLLSYFLYCDRNLKTIGVLFPECPPYRSREHRASVRIQSSWFGGRGWSATGLGSLQEQPDQGWGWLGGRCENTKEGKGGIAFLFSQFHQLICTTIQHQCQLLLRNFQLGWAGSLVKLCWLSLSLSVVCPIK